MLFILFNGFFRDFVQFDGAEQGEIRSAHGENDAVNGKNDKKDGFLRYTLDKPFFLEYNNSVR